MEFSEIAAKLGLENTVSKADLQQAAQQKLRAEVANLVITTTEKILAQSLDSVAQHALVKQSLEEI